MKLRKGYLLCANIHGRKLIQISCQGEEETGKKIFLSDLV